MLYEGEIVGEYFADILISDKILLEIKAAKNVAEVAMQNGVPTDVCFFGTETAKKMIKEVPSLLSLTNSPIKKRVKQHIHKPVKIVIFRENFLAIKPEGTANKIKLTATTKTS